MPSTPFLHKYKTELCKNWENEGSCIFGDQVSSIINKVISTYSARSLMAWVSYTVRLIYHPSIRLDHAKNSKRIFTAHMAQDANLFILCGKHQISLSQNSWRINQSLQLSHPSLHYKTFLFPHILTFYLKMLSSQQRTTATREKSMGSQPRFSILTNSRLKDWLASRICHNKESVSWFLKWHKPNIAWTKISNS